MSIGKVITADLQNDISGTYDPDKTYIAGNVAQKILNGVPCVGAPLVSWQDVITLSGETVIRSVTGKTGNTIFGFAAPATGTMRVVMGSFNSATGLWTYVGKITVLVPYIVTTMATVHTLRQVIVDDTNPLNIRIWFNTVATGTNATHNGGVFQIYKLTASDFTLVPQTIPFATSSDQKGIYFHQDPSFVGILNTAAGSSPLATTIGLAYKSSNKKMWVPDGTVATLNAWRITEFDFSSAPTVANSGAVVVTAASPAKVNWTSHGKNANDCIRFPSSFGGTLPTGLSFDTDYFVRNPSANDFELSSTFGGASINTTGSNGSATAVHSFGVTTQGWSLKTSGLQANTGLTALLLGCVSYCTPQSGHAAHNGTECVYIGCSTASILIPISEITSGATIIPNLLSVNLLGATNEVVSPTAISSYWSDHFDRFVYIIGGSILIGKKAVNNALEDKFGVDNNEYLEGVSQTNLITQFGFNTVTCLEISGGWIHLVGGTVGQRGILSLNTGSDYRLDAAKIITKKLSISDIYTFIGFASALQKGEKCAPLVYYYRTNLDTDFSNTTTGWQGPLSNSGLMTSIPTTGITDIQFLIKFKLTDEFLSNPSQVIEMFFAYIAKNQMSSNWIGSIENSSRKNESLTKTAFRLMKAYSLAVPKLYFRAFDDDGNLVVQANTVDNASDFKYSTNNGTTWTALGTIPNVIETTELQYTWTTAPSVKVTCSLREE